MTNPFLPLAEPSRLWGVSVNDLDVIRLSPRRVAPDLMRLFLSNRTPITLWGPVGARKTRTIESLAREKDANGNNYQVISIIPSTQDPTIIHGIMYIADDADGSTVMKRSIPQIAKEVVDWHESTGGYTIIFMDEMTTAMPSVQNTLLGLLTHGKFEGIDISPLVTFVMAANPPGTVSVVNPLGEAVMNRGGHIAWYGDLTLFLDEWKTGFNGAVRPPDEQIKWYIESLLMEAPESAFRNERWDPSTLVPWDMMEHTERSVTETAGLIERVEEAFAGCDDQVRHHYIIEVTKAMLGPEWANRMAAVTEREARAVSPNTIVNRVREANIKPDSEGRVLEGLDLHTTPSGERITLDQAHSVFNNLVSRSLVETATETYFNQDIYLAAWAFLSTMESEGDRAGALAAHGLPLIGAGHRAAFILDVLPKPHVIPAFVPIDARNRTREIVVANKEMFAA